MCAYDRLEVLGVGGGLAFWFPEGKRNPTDFCGKQATGARLCAMRSFRVWGHFSHMQHCGVRASL